MYFQLISISELVKLNRNKIGFRFNVKLNRQQCKLQKQVKNANYISKSKLIVFFSYILNK